MVYFGGMKDYDWTSFRRKIAIKSDIDTLYKAWTCAAEIEKWFLSKAVFLEDGKDIGRTSPINKGMTYQWNWYLFDGLGEGKILDANGKDHLQFTFAGNCIVDVSMTTHKDHVIVELSQKNIPTDDESKRGIRIGCDFGWFFYLLNLKSTYEGGIDLRNKDEELKGMLNN